MNFQSTLKHYRSGKYDYIYIYYKHKGDVIRINTHMPYMKGMHRKDLLYSSKVEFYKLKNDQIIDLKKKVDEYISKELATYGGRVNQKRCQKYIETGELHQSYIYITPKKKSFFDFYDEFYEFKKRELQNRPSVKDYKSLENALRDYEKYSNSKLSLNAINDTDFINRFRNFLIDDHSSDKMITRGGLNNNTLQKRISSLKTFMTYIQDKGYYQFEPKLFKYRVKKYQTDYVVLSRDEIRQLEDLEIKKDNWQKVIDVFVCNCFMGMRFSDLSTLDKGEFLQDEDGDYYYRKKNEKTDVIIEIPILPTAKKILVKYDFKLPVFTNQHFNRLLRKVLEHYDLFPEEVKKSEIRGNMNYTKTYKKRELISSHTCRRTFITLAIQNNVPLNAIQAATGHTQLSTLTKYVKRIRNKEQLRKID